MKVSDGSYINGLRLIDRKGNFIVNVSWDDITNEGDWIEYEVPDGHEIIGIQSVFLDRWYNTKNQK